jgi:hypothetical protein
MTIFERSGGGKKRSKEGGICKMKEEKGRIGSGSY